LSRYALALELAASGVSEFSISIHGSCAGVHDALTRVKGSYEESWRGLLNLLLLKRKGFRIRVGVICVVTRLNLGDMQNFLRKFFSVPGLDSVNLNAPILSGNALRHFDQVGVRHAEIVSEVRRFVEAQRRRGRRPDRPGLLGVPVCVAAGLDTPFTRLVLFETGARESRSFRQEDLFGYRVRQACRDCAAAFGCPGLQEAYLERFGWQELRPL